MVIADGAAIGSEMNELYQMMRHKPAIKCYLPESFDTKDSYLRYSKSKLNKAYLHEKVKQAIMNVTKSVGW